MINEGIINVYKPAGMTSHDCIYVVRRLTGIKRVGHTGTLDPNATGVLPVCIGGAARVTEYLDMDYKTYRCSMILGLETDTQDIWGTAVKDTREELLARQREGGEDVFTKEDIIRAFSGFDGVIEQMPPKYSAVRVDGRRLYEYARDGVDVKIKTRKIFIKDLNIENIDFSNLEITFTVTCSKGTYIRTICHDVGEILGTGAAMSSVVRVASGVFNIESAIDLEYLRALKNKREANVENPDVLTQIEEEVNGYIRPVEEAIVNFGEAKIKKADKALWFVNGGHIRMSEVDLLKKPPYAEKDFPVEIREEYRKAYNMYAPTGQFLGVAFYSDDYKKLVADKVFSRYSIEE